jgi:hypothetical protein
MSYINGPKIVTDGLILCLDAANLKSYPGSGSSWVDLCGIQNGTIINSPTFSSEGKGSLDFNGTNQYVDMNKAYSGLEIQSSTSNYTLESWIKVRTSQGTVLDTDSIVGNNSNYGVGMQVGIFNSKPRINYGARSTNNFYGSSFEYNAWTHVALSRIHEVSCKSYLNGQPDTSIASTQLSVLSTSWGNMTIGYSGPRITGYYDGYIAVIRIYNKGLTDDEIFQNYVAIKGRFGD